MSGATAFPPPLDGLPFTLPNELQELQRVVRRVVTDELLPLEPECLASPAPAYGVGGGTSEIHRMLIARSLLR